MNYALVGPSNEVKAVASNIDPQTGTKAGWKWLPLVNIRPDFDSQTQMSEGPVRSFYADRVEDVWTVRNKTAPELTAEVESRKEQMLDSLNDIQNKVLFNHENRIRALEGKAAITPAQFRAALKGLL